MTLKQFLIERSSEQCIQVDTRVNPKEVDSTYNSMMQQKEEQKEALPSPDVQDKTKTTKRIQRGSTCWSALTTAGGSVTRPLLDLCEPFLRPMSPRAGSRADAQAIAQGTVRTVPSSSSSSDDDTNAALSITPRQTLVLKLDKSLRRGTLVRNQPGRAQVSVAVKVLQVNRLGQYLVHDGSKMLFVPPAQVIKPGENGIRRLQTVMQAYNLFKTKDWRTLVQFCQKSLVDDFALF